MDNLEKWITAILNLAVFPILEGVGGPSRNRTGVQGFAVLCVTTPPSGRKERPVLWREGPPPVKPPLVGSSFDE